MTADVKRLIPRTVKQWVRSAQITADRESARTYREVERGRPGPPRMLRVKALGGAPIWIRPRSSDIEVLRDTFLRHYHLPPEGVEPRRLIWDLGANIGTTMAHMAYLFPEAEIVGVEMDPANAELARRNVEPWADRCSVIEAAVWPEAGQVEFVRTEGKEWGSEILEGGGHFARTLQLDDLPGDPEYVKMDIEEAEFRVLRENTEWARRVRSIKVEVHLHRYSVSECLHDLDALGFRVSLDHSHYGTVVGFRG